MAMYSENVQRITEDPSVLSVVPPVSSNLALDMGVAQSYSHQALEPPQGPAPVGVAPGRLEPVETKAVPLNGPPGERRDKHISSGSYLGYQGCLQDSSA